MIASVLIILFSAALFVYWFRYTCVLILSTKTARDYTAQVAEANQLGVLETLACLKDAAGQQPLEALRESLDRDYRVLTTLLRHAADFRIGGYSVEQRMLMVDYKAMRILYRLARGLSESHARAALEEMSGIVAHFANAMGERAAVTARA